MGDHALGCRKSNDSITRHNIIRDVIFAYFISAVRDGYNIFFSDIQSDILNSRNYMYDDDHGHHIGVGPPWLSSESDGLAPTSAST